MKYLIAVCLLLSACSSVPTKEHLARLIFRVYNPMQGSVGTAFIVKGASGLYYAATNAHVCGHSMQTPMVLDDIWGNTALPALIDTTADLCLIPVVGYHSALKVAPTYETHLSWGGGYPHGGDFVYYTPIAEVPHAGWHCAGTTVCYHFKEPTIQPGSSGSPMFNDRGEVNCMVNAIMKDPKMQTALCVPTPRLSHLLQEM